MHVQHLIHCMQYVHTVVFAQSVIVYTLLAKLVQESVSFNICEDHRM